MGQRIYKEFSFNSTRTAASSLPSTQSTAHIQMRTQKPQRDKPIIAIAENVHEIDFHITMKFHKGCTLRLWGQLHICKLVKWALTTLCKYASNLAFP